MWIALYEDGNRLEQFDSNGVEHQFYEIEQDRLEKFIVRDDTNEIILNINTGKFKANGVDLSFDDIDCDRRLIYFRRVRQTLGNNSPVITEFVGWQSTIPGSHGPHNIKRIICVVDAKIIIKCD